jgi:polyisoprenyl-teichoic acid--peptidoglycan teichoic acid transferase
MPQEATVSAPAGTPLDGATNATGENGVSWVHTAEPAQVSEPPEVFSTAAQHCGGPARMDLLLIGSDTRAGDYESGRADFIRAVKVDWELGTVRLLAIPRDLFVAIPLEPAHPIQDRINTAFAYGNVYHVPGGGQSLLAQTLYNNFGLTFDHYVVVNFDAFKAGVDAVGGVDLDLPNGVDGTWQGLRAFPAGPQHLDGAALLDYVRVRYIDSDVHRGQRQDQVIQALRKQVLRPGVVADVPGLALALKQLILTDLSAEEVSSLVCAGQRLPPEALTAWRIGWNEVTAHTTSEGAQVLLPRMDRVLRVVQAFVTGTEQP